MHPMDTQLAEVMTAVARVGEEVKGCRNDIQENHVESIKRLDDHGKRVAYLERTRAKQTGAGKVVAGIAAAAGAVLGYLKLGS